MNSFRSPTLIKGHRTGWIGEFLDLFSSAKMFFHYFDMEIKNIDSLKNSIGADL